MFVNTLIRIELMLLLISYTSIDFEYTHQYYIGLNYFVLIQFKGSVLFTTYL